MVGALKRAVRRGEAGFTLVEVIVAMVITAMVMAALGYAVVSSLFTIQQARQRQTATALATQQLERLRALPYDLVTQPDPSAPTVAVDYTTTSGSVTTFSPPARLVPGGINEQLVVNTVSGKTITQVSGNVTYSIETYVTKAPLTASGSQPFNLTAIVRWTSTVSRGQRETVQRSTTFSSAGCLSTANSPFAAPCQAYYTVRAGEALSGVTVGSVAGPNQPIEGMDAQQLQLDLSHTSSNLLVEQTASGTSAAVTSGAVVTGASTSTSGDQSAGAAVDSDPSSVPNQSASMNTPAQTSTTLTTSGAGGTLAVHPFASDQGNARAAIAALSSLCTNWDGTPLTTGVTGSERPCAASNLTTSGATGAALTYTDPNGTSVQLAQFLPAVAPSRAVATLLGTQNSNVCSTGSVVDCAHAASGRYLGASSFGAGTFASAPAGFSSTSGLWSVTSIQEDAVAEEGAGALGPQYQRVGQVQVWNGSAYQTLDLGCIYGGACLSAAQTVTIGATTVQYGGGLSVSYEGTLTVQPPSVTQSAAVSPRTGNLATDCKTTACTTSVSGAGGVVGHVTVTISNGAGPLTSFEVTVDLGGLTANASYKAAANA